MIVEVISGAAKPLLCLRLLACFYSDDRPVFGDWWTCEQVYSYPLGLMPYPPHFLAGLFSISRARASACHGARMYTPVYNRREEARTYETGNACTGHRR
jgi:hypothetical protein